MTSKRNKMRTLAALALFALVGSVAYGASSPEIRIVGNKALSSRALRQAASDDLANLQANPASRAAVDDAAFQMATAYRRQGFPDVRVSTARTAKPKGGEQVVFTIEEGLRTVVEAIAFTGNVATASDNATLRSLIELPQVGVGKRELFVRAALRSGSSAIADHYRRLGYRDVQVSQPQISPGSQAGRVKVGYQITEGVRYQVTTVEILGDCPAELSPALDAKTAEFVGQPYEPTTVLQLKSRVLTLFASHGYPESEVRVAAETDDPTGRVKLAVTIAPGEHVVIRNVIIVGASETAESFIRKTMEWPDERVYSLNARDHAYRQLYLTGLFSQVRFALLPCDVPGKRDLQVSVVETSTREYYVEPGWGSYELLRLRAGISERNLFGRGRDLNLEALASSKALRLSLGLTDPWFLGSGVSVYVPAAVGRREEPAFVSEEATLGLLFSGSPRDDFTITAGWKGAIKLTPDVDAAAADIATDDDYVTSLATMQMVFDRRDDILFPRSGFRVHLSLDVADEFIGSRFNFVRASGGLRVFVPLAENTVLALRCNTGVILPVHGTAELPIGERFFNGGESTVRSFQAGELGPVDANGVHTGGLASNTINLALRQRIAGPWHGSIFVDWGNVSPNNSRAELNSIPNVRGSDLIDATMSDYFSDWRPALGFGLMYALPVGPARLDFAFNPDRRDDERNFTIHLSIGVAF